ncbi:MAG TPA: hypothetical protein VG942_17470 [Hyphomonadaceae bacterium]|nr:hypothetical protein [Hyphomonadaceae bacterium]
MTRYVVKANNDVLSHCKCEFALAANPAQADCPWCGCGWLIPCLTCHRVFTYGVVIEHDDVRSLILRDNAANRVELTASEVDESIAWWEKSLADYPVGHKVVYLDGWYFGVEETQLAFEGWYAVHDLRRLPHAEALSDPARLRAVLGDVSYWRDRERLDRN